ncbi:hypothetical protein, partial [uncultured Methanobrevibacter sp.]|uniref:hypothetical protein n=1 Tax=uncultured Methanobrevibacter sp. TaxID=253161 RepID=UPI00258DAE09
TAVSALDLQTQDFDGHFKMDVPKDASFKKVNDTYESGAVYIDEKNKITISYTDKEDYSGSFPSFTADAGTKMYEDGNYSVMEFPDGTKLVSYIDESHLVLINSTMEVKDIESMLDTIDF